MKEPTQRSRRKAERRQQLLAAAARLFADRGFRAVSIEDLGATVGISGPAVYRHFPGKEAILAELLEGVSRRMLAGGQAEVRPDLPASVVLRRLIAFHTDFALEDADLIRVYDRDFTSLLPAKAKTVRQLQRAYVELWVEVLRRVDPLASVNVARTKSHAIFGLLNSTPHLPPNAPADVTRHVLESMATSALLGPADLTVSGRPLASS
jgi:AcrR family transcriptional regulator